MDDGGDDDDDDGDGDDDDDVADDDDDEHGCRQVFWKCRKCDVAAQPRDVGNPQNTILLFSTYFFPIPSIDGGHDAVYEA